MTGARCDFLANSMDLSICIITHSQPVLLPQCVAACISEIGRSQLAAEIIIVDNASSDRYPERLAAVSPMIRIHRNEENLGFGMANNIAIRISRGRYVLILNDDAVLQEGSLGLMVQRLDADPTLAAVGPTFLNSDRSPQNDFMYLQFPRLRRVLCEHLLLASALGKNRITRSLFALGRKPWASPDWLAGACLLVRREALDSVGLFDDGFYYLFEDTDLCWRFRKAGWHIASVAEAQVVHYRSASYSKWVDCEQRLNLVRSTAYFFKKHSSPQKYFLVRLSLGGVLLIRTPFGILRWIGRGLSYEEVNDRTRANLRLVRSVLWDWR